VNKGHGRQEKRTTILTKTQDWAGLKQGFALTRERTVQGVTTRETVYGITSLSVEQADAGRLLALTRGHWGIENPLSDCCSNHSLCAAWFAPYHSGRGPTGVGHMV
jgi:hypothetical protein